MLDSTADLVNAFISIAQQHMATESAAAAKARQLAEQTADTEIARLKAQNVLLAQLLTSEKAKTARLRTDLVQNLTSLIVGFTDAQDASWSEAVATVQAANDAGVNEMGSFATAAGNQFAESSQGRQLFARELDLAGATSGEQRIAGRDAMQEVQHGLRGRLEEYGRETMGEASRMADMVNGHCARLEESAVEGRSSHGDTYLVLTVFSVEQSRFSRAVPCRRPFVDVARSTRRTRRLATSHRKRRREYSDNELVPLILRKLCGIPRNRS